MGIRERDEYESNIKCLAEVLREKLEVQYQIDIQLGSEIHTDVNTLVRTTYYLFKTFPKNLSNPMELVRILSSVGSPVVSSHENYRSFAIFSGSYPIFLDELKITDGFLGDLSTREQLSDKIIRALEINALAKLKKEVEAYIKIQKYYEFFLRG